MPLAFLVSLLAAAALYPGQTASRTPPLGPYAAATPAGMGYFLMQGTRIVSPAYKNVADCYKDLAKIKQTMAPGVNTLVCVHRAP